MEKRFFAFGEKEMEYLAQKDKKLGETIRRLGPLEKMVTPDLFAALAESVIGQQISGKAADTVCARLAEKTEMDVRRIHAMPVDEIQRCGMSMRKAEYVKNIAEAVISGDLDLERLPEMSDMEVIQTLITIKGVGVWTAEMMLIFSLERPDVVSFGDLGIRRGMMRLYGLKELPKEKFCRYAKRYSPYGSVASLYLWALASE